MIDVTEQEIRNELRTGTRHITDPRMLELHEAFIEIWKQGRIIPVGRDAQGRVIWDAANRAD